MNKDRHAEWLFTPGIESITVYKNGDEVFHSSKYDPGSILFQLDYLEFEEGLKQERTKLIRSLTRMKHTFEQEHSLFL